VRIFIVVAKNRPDLFQYFSTGLAGIQGIEVILDRRIGNETPPPADRQSERRDAQNIYEELEIRGFVIVRLPA
jgi:hypothetical protein